MIENRSLTFFNTHYAGDRTGREAIEKVLNQPLTATRASQLDMTLNCFQEELWDKQKLPSGRRPDGLWFYQGQSWQDYMMALVDAPTFLIPIPAHIQERPKFKNYTDAKCRAWSDFTIPSLFTGESPMFYYMFVVIAQPVKNSNTGEVLKEGVFDTVEVLAANDAAALMMATAKLTPFITKEGADRCQVKQVAKSA